MYNFDKKKESKIWKNLKFYIPINNTSLKYFETV